MTISGAGSAQAGNGPHLPAGRVRGSARWLEPTGAPAATRLIQREAHAGRHPVKMACASPVIAAARPAHQPTRSAPRAPQDLTMTHGHGLVIGRDDLACAWSLFLAAGSCIKTGHDK
jgi:hypothetical protein